MVSNPFGRQAVVIGAGMGGLAAAGALAKHFERVTVLERDALSPAPTPRAGTPQDRHVHALMVGGLRALSEIFPDFEQDLERAGAVPLRLGLDIRIERPDYDPFPQRDLGWVSYAVSRPAIEYCARHRVENLANTTLRHGCRVREVIASQDGTAVTGVHYDNPDGTSEQLPADLVIDATGHGGLTLSLLQSIGSPLPEETRIGIDLDYATCVFEIPDDAPSNWKGVLTYGEAPHNSRGGLMLPLEGNRWMATIGGRHGAAPPGDAEGFLAYARDLRTETIYNAIKSAKQVGEIARDGFSESVRRHFERLAAFPHGLLPIADALCRFSPVYGQGMSVAAQEACLLESLLQSRASNRDPFSDLAPAFFDGVQSLIETPWSITTMDFVFPETRGQRPADLKTTLKVAMALTRLAAEDAAVHKLTAEVQHLLKPASAYGDPALVTRVWAVMAELA